MTDDMDIDGVGFAGGIWGECPSCHIGALSQGAVQPPDHAFDQMDDGELEEWYDNHSYWECCHCGWRSDE